MAVLAWTAALRGPSPRARGILDAGPRRREAVRSIPASAGNPQAAAAPHGRLPVHPRERGESRRRPAASRTRAGPSPRARGIRRDGAPGEGGVRSIPASAGNPAGVSSPAVPRWVHPRERGESRDLPSARELPAGPSPRARGIRSLRRFSVFGGGSIPASAGNPRGRLTTRRRGRVHPRERGESRRRAVLAWTAAGPSPRARGIRRQARARLPAAGSIPASAGNPGPSGPGSARPRVHPRERGESRTWGALRRSTSGPSPRARGIPGALAALQPPDGSIPASAGNPRRVARRTRGTGVHPRERGESDAGRERGGRCGGPSPRARGIPPDAELETLAPGSIPASAGNPAPAQTNSGE